MSSQNFSAQDLSVLAYQHQYWNSPQFLEEQLALCEARQELAQAKNAIERGLRLLDQLPSYYFNPFFLANPKIQATPP